MQNGGARAMLEIFGDLRWHHQMDEIIIHRNRFHRRRAGNGRPGRPGNMHVLPQGIHFPHLLDRERERERDRPRETRTSGLAVNGEIISYAPGESIDGIGVHITARPLTPDNNYFEVDILDTGAKGTIAVGLVCHNNSLERQPGWDEYGVAYHGDDGKLFKATGFGRPFGPKFMPGDKVGCGIKFGQEIDRLDAHVRGRRIYMEDMRDLDYREKMVKVFFTLNGKEIGTVTVPEAPGGLFPAIGMHSDGEEVFLNLDAEWEYSDVTLMSVDNTEDEWARLHDIQLNGMHLEYIGPGKSIVDVGLAQAKYPLDTRHHYFEIEITDPGENCYIAIGLTRRDYPKHRHPGWNKGSIAYHADDGKIFLGSGVGDPFGPRCHRGDTMGCGILFPREYNSEADSDGSHDLSPEDENSAEDYLDLEKYESFSSQSGSDSEDEPWWRKGYADNGTKVKVFFTRNGKTIGRRETQIPKGGFYPTVGMLSREEKVRVDLRPLTG